jgi:hypothetical protein
MASSLPNSFKRDVSNGSIDLDTDAIKGMLLTNAAAPNIDTWTKRSDVTNEVVGTGYTAGGAALANKTVTADNTNDRAIFDADDLSWATATITARWLVLYKSRGGAATADELVAFIDFGSDFTSTAATFLVQFAAAGILALT